MARQEIKINTNCVADAHASPGEKIIEFSSPGGGGLISFTLRNTPNGGDPTLVVGVYNTDATVRVLGPGETYRPAAPNGTEATQWSVTDETSGETYEPWTNGHAIGYKITRPGGRVEYLYLNASTGGDGDDHQPNVFVYYGPAGDPAGEDEPLHYYDLND